MNLNAWLAAEKGRQTALAEHLGITLAAISQWRQHGVPVMHMEAIERFTSRAVRVADMVRETRLAREKGEAV